MQVDPEMEFSGSESSDFEDVYQAKEDGAPVQTKVDIGQEDPENKGAEVLNETHGTATVIQAAKAQKVAQGDQGFSAKLSISDIDAQWLNRTLTKFLEGKSPEEVLKHETQILALLGKAAISQRECEKKLISIVSHKKIQLVTYLLKNREVVYFGTCL